LKNSENFFDFEKLFELLALFKERNDAMQTKKYGQMMTQQRDLTH